MTSEQIIKALDKYAAIFAGMGLTADEYPDGLYVPSQDRALRHCYWMCSTAKAFAAAKPDKAMRWLCFIQGVLWQSNVMTIAELKGDNRSPPP